MMIKQGGDLHPEVGLIYLLDPLLFVNERDQLFYVLEASEEYVAAGSSDFYFLKLRTSGLSLQGPALATRITRGYLCFPP